MPNKRSVVCPKAGCAHNKALQLTVETCVARFRGNVCGVAVDPERQAAILVIFRSPEQKADLKKSFYRPDRPFFASGACHVLAHAFIEYNGDEWHPVLIRPEAGFRGNHVFVSNHRFVFDYHGFSSESLFIKHYFKKMQRFFPGWRASLIELTMSPISDEFCNHYNHRRPDQFYKDPQPRAFSFVHRHRNTASSLHRVIATKN